MAKEAFDLAHAEARRELLASEKTDGGAALDQTNCSACLDRKTDRLIINVSAAGLTRIEPFAGPSRSIFLATVRRNFLLAIRCLPARHN
jgi:hypothetical protein